MTHFNSLDFLLLFGVTLLLISISGERWRKAALLVVCCFFAIAATNEFVFAALLLFAVIYWKIGHFLQGEGRGRLLLLWGALGLLWSLAVLSSRYDWMQEWGTRLIDAVPVLGSLRLRSLIVVWSSRVGVSFLALRLTCYLVDATFQRERLSLVDFLLYLFYFPAFVAGPVDRPGRFEEKLSAWSSPKWRDIGAGVERFVEGLFKKFVLADLLRGYTIAELPVEATSGPMLWVGLFAYSLYIYWDFSGYTDIALGVGRCIGLQLPENFDRPYSKSNLSDFWNSWHMSFSFWLRDYIFAPTNLAVGRRWSLPPMFAPVPALLLTMLACGLWHGYTTGFFIWGLHHGVGLSGHRIYQSLIQKRLGRKSYRELSGRKSYQRLGQLVTFLYVSVGWCWFVWPVGAAWVGLATMVGLK
jgi:D-alanyl-lipoteichoic acid acyltransferase DltB (MBOAT superfamily)